MTLQKADITIVGGGIVGLATAYQLTLEYPGKKVIVLEKESRLAQHQTGHNSGVLHSGIYYRPGSLRATNCRAGKEAMEAFCREEEITYDICGKVIVAVDESELPALEKIYERGQVNGVQCEVIDQARLRELEPHAAGIKAIHVPETGIVDYVQVAERMAERIRKADGEIITNAEVMNFRRYEDHIVVESKAGSFESKYVVTCAGLQSDRVARMANERFNAKIVPFRGEYYELKPEAQHLCRTLIYPVPDPKFPFLGVHFTRIIHGGVECGPNAVLAFAREGYQKSDINVRDLFESLTYNGFLKLAVNNWQAGLGEMWRSYSKTAFVKALQHLIPEIRSEHLVSVPAGVRAQALSPDGKLVDDFIINESDRMVLVGNAPSPAATSSLNIGKIIVEKLAGQF
ncbi:L-2-hydroxyglutarate oxidase LhgO [Polystyrenella longa]|uniref:L-2-hydroxyglutarate oxidase LhgO n=1 Tax=Polystyrenella longa TaxID=2528007 RepID=A0A518CRK6_9PLAN|nr:L-2-hydroxyglutarate oxidase [Polystyrenella longa]QDU81862.1 L-2-hydroxyglutarate oxidase LhgO [Polystyrenella longa]